ncbi:MAG TPA: hypothetical protein VFN55_00760 [Solirubrobacteraceae bacterium]|nr:hypothetical protein [Solirubrobacteraceae bacterium]
MAEFIRLRVAAARAGVSLALAALIGGLTAPGASASTGHAGSSSAHFLKLGGLRGNVRQGFLKIETKVYKLESALSQLELKLQRSYPTTQKVNALFDKWTSTAGAQFLKIDAANTEFLKIDDANTQFLKIDDANTQFLKASAASQFLPVGGTALNASQFGGSTPESFDRSATGAATLAPGAPAVTLLATPGGELTVKAGYAAPGASQGGPFIAITNGTSALLPAVQDSNGQDGSADIAPQATRTVFLSASAGQVHVQFFDVPGAFGAAQGSAATLVASTEADGNGNVRFVAQLISGSL